MAKKSETGRRTKFEENKLKIKVATKQLEDILFNLLERNVKTHIEGSKVFLRKKGVS